MFAQMTTTFTTTSTTFVVVINAVNVLGIFGPFFCTATWNYNVNLLTGNTQWRIISSTGLTSNTYQSDDSGFAATSSNTLGSLSWYDNSLVSETYFRLQVQVSSNLITVSVLKGDLTCISQSLLPIPVS